MKTIQINQCTQEELEWLPGVGTATAKKVIEARPVKDIGELEQLIPPAAWLKVQEAGVEFAFGADEEEEISSTSDLEGMMVVPKEMVKLPTELPIILQEPRPLTLRRVKPGQELKPGASYMCIWNVRWGPGGEAYSPADAPTQAEIGAWFQAHDMAVQFAHYGASVRVRTRSRGLVPLVLFEIVEETEDANNEGDGEGD